MAAEEQVHRDAMNRQRERDTAHRDIDEYYRQQAKIDLELEALYE